MKKFQLILILSFIYITSQAQTINIPDANFKNALLNDDVVDTNGDTAGDANADTNNDGEIQLSEAQATMGLDLYDKEITSLEGLENFTNLQSLYVEQNQDLTNIDISQNTELFFLDIEASQITDIDLTNNPNLQYLYLDLNQQLTSLDISENPSIIRLSCVYNQLTSLNIANGNNTDILEFESTGNPDLLCIQVDDVNYANNQPCNQENESGFCKDDFTSYSENCNLGIENNLKESIFLYPNPVSDILHIKSNQPIENVKLYSIQGKLINELSNTENINLSKLAPGFYFVKLTIGNETLTRKIVKK